MVNRKSEMRIKNRELRVKSQMLRVKNYELRIMNWKLKIWKLNPFLGELLDQSSAFLCDSLGDPDDHLDIFIPFTFPLKMRNAETS